MEIKTVVKNKVRETRSRNFAMDLARTIATLYIIGYLHLKGYQDNSFEMPHFGGEMYVSKVVLGLFMFISGYFMAKYTFNNFFKDAWKFYKKRFFRFYILFVIASITLYSVGYISNISKLLLTISGLAPFVLQPGTLWFMTLLMLFYLFTPFLLRHESNASIFLHGLVIYSIAFVISLLLTLVYAQIGGGKFDERFFVYFPVYVSGVMTARNNTIKNLIRQNKYGFITLLLMISIIIIVCEDGGFSNVDLCVLPLGIIAFLFLSQKMALYLSKNNYCVKFVNMIAYGSLCAYLFHRAIYISLTHLLANLGIGVPYIILCCTYLPLTLVISYVVQFIYDKFILFQQSNFKCAPKS